MFTLPLAITSFIAGFLTFLAPCTLPIVPAYLGFISGVSIQHIERASLITKRKIQRKILWNSLLYVAGFTAVFILLGTVSGLLGQWLLEYRFVLNRLGGILIILFGMSMLPFFSTPLFLKFRLGFRLPILKNLLPGKPLSSFLFGAIFALGWTPCVGPILGTILFLAASSATVYHGAILLAIFSLGLGLPFIILSITIGMLSINFGRWHKVLEAITIISAIMLIVFGFLVAISQTSILALFLSHIFRFASASWMMPFL